MFDSVRSWALRARHPAPVIARTAGKTSARSGPHQHRRWPPGPGPPRRAGTSSCPCSSPWLPSSPGGACSGGRRDRRRRCWQLPRGRRGRRRGVAGGGTALGFALLAAASSASWCAAVGIADPGIVALAELGVDLGHLVLVPDPGPCGPRPTATLFDGVDVVLVRPPGSGAAGCWPGDWPPGPASAGACSWCWGRGRWPEGGRRPAHRGGRGVAGGRSRPRPSSGPSPGGSWSSGRRAAARPVRVGPVAPRPSGQVAAGRTPARDPDRRAQERGGGGRCSGCSPSGVPASLRNSELGREARAFGAVVAALEAFATRVDPVRPGVCAVPTRGPSRYFGGDEVLVRMAADAVAGAGRPGTSRAVGRAQAGQPGWGWPTACSPPSWPPAPRWTAAPVIVPPGETPSFLAPWPVAILDRPELADLLVRLGVRTLGGFAALPGPGGPRPVRGRKAPCASGWPGGPRGSCPASVSSSPRSAPGPATRAGPGW